MILTELWFFKFSACSSRCVKNLYGWSYCEDLRKQTDIKEALLLSLSIRPSVQQAILC